MLAYNYLMKLTVTSYTKTSKRLLNEGQAYSCINHAIFRLERGAH